LTGITRIITASYMPCMKVCYKLVAPRCLTTRPLCAYTDLVQKNSWRLRNYGYLEAKRTKTALGGQENGRRENRRRIGRDIFPSPIFLSRLLGSDQVYLILASAFLTRASTPSFDGRVL